MVMMKSTKDEESFDPFMKIIAEHLNKIISAKVAIVPSRNHGKTAVQEEIKKFFEAQGMNLEDFK